MFGGGGGRGHTGHREGREVGRRVRGSMVQPEWGPESDWTSMRIVGSPAAPKDTGTDLLEKKIVKKKKKTKMEHETREKKKQKVVSRDKCVTGKNVS